MRVTAVAAVAMLSKSLLGGRNSLEMLTDASEIRNIMAGEVDADCARTWLIQSVTAGRRKDGNITRSGKPRRDFIKVAAATVASSCVASTARPDAQTAAKVLNYGPRMNYRRLGKMEFMNSEIDLGGHGAGGYDERAVQNRMAVSEPAVELGMNYLRRWESV